MAKAVVLSLLLATGMALVPSSPVGTHLRRQTRVYAEEEKSSALIQVNEETIQTGASVASAAAGFFVGGPVLAVLTAVLGNYVSKQDGDVSEAFRGVGKAGIEFVRRLCVKLIAPTGELLSEAEFEI